MTINQAVVDGNFIRVGAKSFAINKINSVEVKARFVHGPTLMMFFGLATIICAVIAIQNKNPGVGLLAIALGAITLACWQSARIVEYSLVLTTSSKEVAAFKSRDKTLVHQLRGEVEAAMVSQK